MDEVVHFWNMISVFLQSAIAEDLQKFQERISSLPVAKLIQVSMNERDFLNIGRRNENQP